MSANKKAVAQSLGVEEVISQLRTEGVQEGEKEAEGIILNARKKAEEIIDEAEGEADRILQDGQNSAHSIIAKAHAEEKKLLELFMASLPEMFQTKAQAYIDEILKESFENNETDRELTIQNFADIVTSYNISEIMEGLCSNTRTLSVIEELMIMAVAFYANSEGLTTFSIDSRLQASLAKKLSGLELDGKVVFEFVPGIEGFCYNKKSGAQVTVSPHSIKAMLEEWSGDEFRQIFIDMKIGSNNV